MTELIVWIASQWVTLSFGFGVGFFFGVLFAIGVRTTNVTPSYR